MTETYKIIIQVDGEDNASGPLGKVGSALGGIGTIAGGILSAGLLQNIAGGIKDLAMTALDSYAEHERLGMSLQSLAARELVNTGQAEDMASALAMATSEAENLQGWIQELAIKSPFNQKDVADSFRLAMAYGFQTDMAQRLTTAMVDYSAATGASGDIMSRISLALGQIQARGKLAGQEIMQLTEAGIPVRQILADSFGVTTAELEDMISKGLVPADDAIQALVTSIESDFGGAAERQSATFSGLISSLEDIKSVGLREFFEGTFQAIQPYVSGFVDLLSDPATMEKINQFGQTIGTGIGDLIANIGPLTDGIGEFFNRIVESETAQGIISTITDGFNNFGTFWAEQGPGITEMLSGFFTDLGETIGPVVVQVIEWMAEAFQKVSLWFVENGPMIQAVLGGVLSVVTFIVQAVTNLYNVWIIIADFMVTTLLNIGTMILQIFTGDFEGAFETLKTIVSDGFDFVLEYLEGVAVWILDSFFGMTFEEASAVVETAFADIETWFNNIKESGMTALDNIKTGFVAIKDAIATAIEKIKEFFTNLSSGTVPSWVGGLFGAGGNVDGKASGGPVLAGHGYLVGEKGPEWFRPNISGQIIPNHRLGDYGSGVGETTVQSKTYNITVNNTGGALNERDLVNAIKQWEWAYGV